MATGSKRGRKPSTTSKKKTVKKNQNPGIFDEIMLFVAIGVSILMFLGTCGLLGEFGKIIKGLLIGLFGIIGFLFPFAFLFACAFTISNKWEKITRVKLISSCLCIVVFSCFAQLILAKDMMINSISDYYTDNWKSGGFIGGFTSHYLCKFLGMAGTIVLLLVLLVICIILITDRSLFTSVKEGKKILVDDYKNRREYNRQMNEIKSIEREERDLERWSRRQEKYEQKKAKKEEKQAAILDERRRKAEEKLAETSERIKFDALDLKKQEELRASAQNDYVSESTNVEDDDFIEEVPSVRTMREPQPIFSGRASSYREDMAKQSKALGEDVTKIMEENSRGLLSATKLSSNPQEGEIVEITENYCADSEFYDYISANLPTQHRITISPEEESKKQEAYERDVYVEEENFGDAYGDVTDVFAKRRNKANESYEADEDIVSELEDDNLAQPKEEENKDKVVAFVKPKQEEIVKETETYYSKTDLAEENKKPEPVSQVVSQGRSVATKKTGKYKLPPVTLLDEVKNNNNAQNATAELNETARDLKDTLKSFGLDVTIIGSSRGPAVTRYELQMPAGVSVKKITNLAGDIMMSLGAKDIRIEAPIPGKKAVGIELPNRESTMVHFRELIDSKEFKSFDSNVAFGVGKDLEGDIVVSDISKMPHLLIAGATGSGKSVCINTLIMSILFKAKPDEVKLIMIDPKMVELSIYNDIPHLLIPVVTDARKASAALNWAVNEMTVRYQKFSEIGVRDMKGYNAKIASDVRYVDSADHEYMPQIVIVVDELADLMMVASKEVEESICRLAQLARAAGIYLIIATQRPSVDVITGLIKANMPSRIAFSVTSAVDSRTILDMVGAEKLLGYGDMLFFPRGYNKPSRVQGAFVSDDEVERVVSYVKGQSSGNHYSEQAMSAVNAGGASSAGGSAGLVDPNDAYDELFVLAGHAVIESEKASIGMLQRKFKIGFNRAARIMDQLSDEGVVGPEEGTKPRRILMSMEEFNNMLEEKNHQ